MRARRRKQVHLRYRGHANRRGSQWLFLWSKRPPPQIVIPWGEVAKGIDRFYAAVFG